MLLIDWKNVSRNIWKIFPIIKITEIIKVIHTFDEYNNKV